MKKFLNTFTKKEERDKKLQEYRALCKAEAKRAIEYAEVNDIKP